MSRASVAIKEFLVDHVSGNEKRSSNDAVAVEEPMEIRVVFGPDDSRTMRSLSITMRTPGNDRSLAAGFLFTEGILSDCKQIESISFRGADTVGNETGNIVRVDLRTDQQLDFQQLQRHFFTTSSCGVCGKASLEALHVKGLRPIESEFCLSTTMTCELPDRVRVHQPAFEQTGGLHAAGLVGVSGEIVDVQEDVGRHNAVDKLLGNQFLGGQTPLSDNAMIISGRASFEIMQKALVAGLPMVIAVGAPSSLAVEMAEKYRMTLVGFTSTDRCNIYSGGQRVRFTPVRNDG